MLFCHVQKPSWWIFKWPYSLPQQSIERGFSNPFHDRLLTSDRILQTPNWNYLCPKLREFEISSCHFVNHITDSRDSAFHKIVNQNRLNTSLLSFDHKILNKFPQRFRHHGIVSWPFAYNPPQATNCIPTSARDMGIYGYGYIQYGYIQFLATLK